jgi:hypothetical protein
VTALSAKIYEIAGKTVIYSFQSITRSLFSYITRCFIFVFLKAWLSVNQRFSAQNLGHYLGRFLSVMTRFVTRRLVLAMQQTYKQDGNIEKF